MADTIAKTANPDLKMVDLGDGTFAVAAVIVAVPAGGADITFNHVSPALKAVDLGDGTYAVGVDVT